MDLPVHRRIEILLSHYKLTQKQLAERARISENTISNAKKGKNVPNVDFFNAIYMAFPELDPKWLYLGKGKMLVESFSAQEAIMENDDQEDCMKKILALQKEIEYLKIQIQDKEEIIKLLRTTHSNN